MCHAVRAVGDRGGHESVEALIEVDRGRLDAAGAAIWAWYCAGYADGSARLVVQLPDGTVRSTWLRPATRACDIDRVLTTLVESAFSRVGGPTKRMATE